MVLLKTRQPAVTVSELEVTAADADRLRLLYEAVWADIERGCSFPNGGWWCADCQWKRHCDQA